MDDAFVKIKTVFDAKGLDKEFRVALQRGLNKGAVGAKGEAIRRINRQNVGVEGRSFKTIKASVENLRAALIHYDNPIPLSRYLLSTPAQARREKKVRFRIKPGHVVTSKRFFIMGGKKKAPVLAMRLKPGARVPHRHKPKFANEKGLAFGFFGPSVAQMFIPGYNTPGSGVAGEMAKWAGERAEQEFFRQVDLIFSKKV